MGLEIFEGGGGSGTGDATEAKQDIAQTAINKVPASDSNVSWNATALAAIKTQATGAVTDSDLDHIAKTADGGTVYPTKVADNTVLSIILTKDSGGDTSDFNNSTDSLEAIADSVAAIPTTAMRGTDNAALASVVGALNTAAATGVVTETDPIMAYTKQLVTAVGDPARNIDTIIGTRWDSSGDLGTDIAAIITANPAVLATGTLTTSSTTVPADTNRVEGTNFWNGCILRISGGTYAGERARIGVFTATTGVFTLETPLPTAPGTVTYEIIPSASDGAQHVKDVWCTAQLNEISIGTSGADKDFPDVVVAAQGAARGLPIGAVCIEAHLLMMFDTLDSSTAANYIKTAGDDIRVMIDGQAWTDAPIAYTSVAKDWYTSASGMSSHAFECGNNVVLATYGVTTTGVGTYHVGTDETAAGKAIEAQGASLVMYNVRTGLRLYYRMP